MNASVQSRKSPTPPPEMYLVGVIPITKEPLKEELSYFSRRPLTVGSLVEIPLRSRELFALVSSCESVLDQKSVLKSAPFAIKKIESIKEGRIFDTPFVRAAEETAAYFATGVGNVLRSHIPEEILLNWEGALGDEIERTGIAESFLLQAPFEERISTYRALIREEFAKKQSLMVVVPNKLYALEMAGEMSKGIDEYTYLLYSDLSKKEQLSVWKKAFENSHPILIIATPGFLSFPRADIGTYIIEQESALGYKGRFRPFLDARITTEFVARERKARIVFADTFLSFETLARKDNHTALPLSPLKNRLVSGSETALIDLKKKKDRKGDYFLSDELIDTIRKTLERDQRVFLFTTRKGFAPLTICNDCGTTLTCPTCARPLVLHAKRSSLRDSSRSDETHNIFMCHSCSKEYPGDTRCAHCKSWRLAPLGVGVERIRESMTALFPETPLFAIDGDSTKTHKQALDVAMAFEQTPASILIGTEMSLPYLGRADVSAVISADNLFAIPDFKIAERLMHFLVLIREKTRGAMIIQTRKPDVRVFTHAVRGTVSDFFREDMESRKKYGYPPYTLFIKITREGKSVDVDTDMKYIEEAFAEWNPEVFSGFHIPAPGEETLHALIRIDPKSWPEPRLSSLLRGLPPQFTVEIDPEGLL